MLYADAQNVLALTRSVPPEVFGMITTTSR